MATELIKQYAIDEYLLKHRTLSDISLEIKYSPTQISNWVSAQRKIQISNPDEITREKLVEYLKIIGVIEFDGCSVDGNKSNQKYFHSFGLDYLWNYIFEFTDFLSHKQIRERLYCFLNNITEPVRCKFSGCSGLVKFHNTGSQGKPPGYSQTCGLHGNKIRDYKGNKVSQWQSNEEHSRLNTAGYKLVIDPLWSFEDTRTNNGRLRFRVEHLVLVESILKRRINSHKENVHHLDGNKVNNQFTNFFLCNDSRHRIIEAKMQLHGKQLEFGEKPLLTIDQRYELLSPFKRLNGMFIQVEIYEQLILENKIQDWSEGPKSKWETRI